MDIILFAANNSVLHCLLLYININYAHRYTNKYIKDSFARKHELLHTHNDVKHPTISYCYIQF